MIALMTGVLYFSSCSDNKNDNLNVRPDDSVSKGSYVQLQYSNKSYFIHDLVLNSSPVYTMAASTIATDQFDTMFTGTVLLSDFKSKQIRINMVAINDSATGIYTVRNNVSTLVDNSEGKNKKYSIALGSKMNILVSDIYYIEGTLDLILRSNYDSTNATGTFRIYK
jgi:hypothetical protein